MRLQISDEGVAFIKQHEELRLFAYDDAQPWAHIGAGALIYGTLTIGYGHTGEVVYAGQVIDEARADDLLRRDLSTAEQAVNRLVTTPMTQGQFDALVSFVFNAGAGALASSTLLRKLNAGDTAGAAAEFSRWVYTTVDGVKMVARGLVRRRAEEQALFLSGMPYGRKTVDGDPTLLAVEEPKEPSPVPIAAGAAGATAVVGAASNEVDTPAGDLRAALDVVGDASRIADAVATAGPWLIAASCMVVLLYVLWRRRRR